MPGRIHTGALLTLLAALAAAPASSQGQEKPAKPARLFEDHSTLEVTLRGPWRSIARRPDNPVNYDGQLTYTDADGQAHTLDVGITTRGLTRKRICEFPPLKLWFDKEQVKGSTFRGQSSLKMVTHCKPSRGVEQYYVTEYLAYRIYNLITDLSFRVRPLSVTYEDTERKSSKQVQRFGFLIEDVDDMANRNDLRELEVPEISHRSLDPVAMTNYALFQYLIANLDWSSTGGNDPVECCHNSKLLAPVAGNKPVYAVPYDLDSSGLVNADYAAPPEKLRVSSVTQRLYRGFCAHNDELPAGLERFRAKREAIMDLFNTNELLTPGGKRNAVEFLEEFYTRLAEPGAVKRLLIDKCRR